jgi:hypothetical protein
MTPVNESIPMYPVSKAIGRYLRDGSTDELAALGVSRIVARAWLQTDPSIRFQLALPLPDWIAHAASTSRSVPHALPELTVGGFPAIGTLDANFGAGNVFFGDARGVTGAFAPPGWRDFAVVRAIEPDNVFVSAADGWVDARLAFVEDPDLAQPYGGAVTTNASATLPVVPGFALVFARGALLARDGTPIVTNSGGYRWVAVHENVRAVRCAGLCVVAAEAAQVPSAPLDPPSQHSEGVAFSTPIPWFVSAELPAGSLPLLRYNVRFDPKWAAFFDGTALPHLRIDGAVNGWLVPPRAHAAKVYLIETGAALTTLSEIVAVTIVCSLVFYALRNPTKESAFAIDPTASNETTM